MALLADSTPSGERFVVGPARYRWIVDSAVAMLTLIVFSGAAVRLTGSGLGCPDWPGCNGSLVPVELDSHVAVEYGNRLMSGLVGVACMAAGLMAFRLRPFRRDLIVPALLLPAGVLGQGVLGGLTVIFDLRWPFVIAHYLLSMVLLVAAVVLAWRARRPAGAPAPTHEPRLVRCVRWHAIAGALIIVAGTLVTAAGPHSGGAGTGDIVERLRISGADSLQNLIYLHGHSATMWGLAAVALWFFARRLGGSAQLRRTLTVVCLLIAAQGAVGLIQYHSQLPAEVVWVHASLAAVLWIALVWAVLAAGRPA